MDMQYPWPQEAPEQKPAFYNALLQRAREGKNEWWRYVVGVALSFFVGYQLVGAIPLVILIFRAVILKYVTFAQIGADSSQILSATFLHVDLNTLLAALLAIFVGAMVFLWIAVRFIHRRPFMSIISGKQGSFDMQRFFTSFGIWLTLCIAQFAIAYNLNPDSFHYVLQPGPFIGSLVICLIMLPIQTGWEELFFRGYLMQGFGSWMKNPIWPWIITSVLFGLMHSMNNEVQANGLLKTLPLYIIPGLIFGAVALLDEGLELSMGMHFAQNLFGLLTVTSPDMSIKSNAIWETPSSVGDSDAIFGTVFQLVAFGILFSIYKWDIKKLTRKYA